MQYRIDQEPPTYKTIKRNRRNRLIVQYTLIIVTLVLSGTNVAVTDIKHKLDLMFALTMSIFGLLAHSWFLAATPTPCEITPSQCEDILRWRTQSFEIDQYVKKVVAMKRELVQPEYAMLRAKYDEIARPEAKTQLYGA